MGTYRKEWDCCGSATETNAWEPDDCPFCTSAAPVSAPLDTQALPPLPQADNWWREEFGLGDSTVHEGHSDEQMQDYARQAIAPYAEHISLLEQDNGLLSLIADQFKARLASADERIAHLERELADAKLQIIADMGQDIERELAERKPASIDTHEFQVLMGNWGQACWSESGDGDDDEFHWKALIAYIDGRIKASPDAAPAVPAPTVSDELTEAECAFVELVKANPGRKLGHREAFDSEDYPLWRKPEALGLITCVGSYKWRAAAPSPQSKQEEAK